LALVDPYRDLRVQRRRQRRVVFLIDHDESGIVHGALFLAEVAKALQRQRLQMRLLLLERGQHLALLAAAIAASSGSAASGASHLLRLGGARNSATFGRPISP